MDKNWISVDEQVDRINKLVHKNDTLVILGDVGDVEYVRQLRAKYKILIMGNHDAGSTNYKREIIKRIFDKDIHPDKTEIRAIMEKEFQALSTKIGNIS